MECNYEMVKNGNVRTNVTNEWKFILRQLHMSSGAWTFSYMAGLCAGAPTVFIPQLRRDENYKIDDELSSWLYSVSHITAIPWVLILPLFTRYMGRKPAYILNCIFISAVFIILYFSTSPYHILVAGVIQGFVNASNITIMTLVLNEYSSRKYRDIVINVAIPSFYWGIWTSNAIGTYFYWKYIAVLGIICSSYAFTVALYPESPVWLAIKGKYKQSEEVFKWMHGDSEEANKEINELIKSQMDYQDSLIKNKHDLSLKAIIKRREFYRPVLLCILIGAQYNFSGKYVYSTYAIDVIGQMTNSDRAAHCGMLILDGITILGLFLGTFLTKILKRRPQYFTSSFTGVFFLFMISFYLYLARHSIIIENHVVTISLLVIYSVALSSGSMIMCALMYNDIVLLRYQASTYVISSLSLFMISSALLKLAPMAIKYMSIHGTFFFCGIMCGSLTIILYFYLPETKGTTHLEREKYFESSNIEPLNVK